jgi:hypothetical protein
MSDNDNDSDTPAYRAYITGTEADAQKALEAMIAKGGPDAKDASIWLNELIG